MRYRKYVNTDELIFDFAIFIIFLIISSYKIENKSQSTAIYLKDAVVSCTDQKSKNQTIKEKKILITIKNSKSGKRIRMKIGQKLNVRGTKQSFHPPRNPGNFNQKIFLIR